MINGMWSFLCPALSCHKIFLSVDFPPKLLSLFFLHWYFSVWWVPACFTSFLCGISWLGCSIVAAMGALYNLGADCQKGKLLDTPGTQPSTGNAVVKCNNYLNVFEFTFIHRSRQPIPRKVKWQSHILEQCWTSWLRFVKGILKDNLYCYHKSVSAFFHAPIFSCLCSFVCTRLNLKLEVTSWVLRIGEKQSILEQNCLA